MPRLFSQIEEGPIPLEPYPTRSTGPSVEFGQAYQSVGPNMPPPQIGVLKVAPRLDMEKSKGRESIVTAELKALVFLDKEDQVKADGVPGLSGVVTSLSQLITDCP